MTYEKRHEIDVLIGLNYYSPYVSGLTNVARDVAEYLAAQGKRVTVVTTQHEPDLPLIEVVNGVTIRRAKVIGRVDRAPLSPGFVRQAIVLGRQAELVNLHLPMPEAGAIAVGIRSKTPLVLTYQCDPPKGVSTKGDLVQTALDISHRAAIRRSSMVVASSIDYAKSSRVLTRFPRERTMAIAPPSWARPTGSPSFRQSGGTHFGFLGRLTSEKGADVLIKAFRAMASQDQRLIIAGEGLHVAGDSALNSALAAAADDSRIVFLGRIPDEALGDFYASIDYFCLPSTNSFEAFGIVQVEALMAGVPVIASDLPGVRTPVQETGGGLLVAPGDVSGFKRALIQAPEIAISGAELTERAVAAYGATRSLVEYQELFETLAINQS